MSPALLLASTLALLAAADDASDRRDRLAGWWSCSQLPNLPKDVKATMRLHFASDGNFTLNLEMPGVSKRVTGTWKFSGGDKMIIENLSEPLGNRRNHDQTVVIKQNELTLQDGDGTVAVFKRE
jgi:hypothetical protein